MPFAVFGFLPGDEGPYCFFMSERNPNILAAVEGSAMFGTLLLGAGVTLDCEQLRLPGLATRRANC